MDGGKIEKSWGPLRYATTERGVVALMRKILFESNIGGGGFIKSGLKANGGEKLCLGGALQ